MTSILAVVVGLGQGTDETELGYGKKYIQKTLAFTDPGIMLGSCFSLPLCPEKRDLAFHPGFGYRLPRAAGNPMD